jgi:hypothetical protein
MTPGLGPVDVAGLVNVLIGLGGILIGWYAKHRKQKPQEPPAAASAPAPLELPRELTLTGAVRVAQALGFTVHVGGTGKHR